MAQYEEVQRDFSGGEISGRMIMRDDVAAHARSVAFMENFIPTLQGTAVRAPGTRFVYEMSSLDARIFPYKTPENIEAIVEVLPATEGGPDGDINIIQNINALVGSSLSTRQFSKAVADQKIPTQIVDNFSFRDGFEGWDANPIGFISNVDQATLGWEERSGALFGTCRGWKSGSDPASLLLRTTATIPEDTAYIIILPTVEYVANFSGPDAEYTAFIRVGTTEGDGDVFEHEFTGQPGKRYDLVTTESTAFVAGTVLYLEITITAIKKDGVPSTPAFRVEQFGIASEVTKTVDTSNIIGVVPYLADELDDIHYVQSPYNDSAGLTGYGKELVLTHPNYPVKDLLFNGTNYVFLDKFSAANNPPNIWGDPMAGKGGYPATCTSYLGRLVLGGSTVDPILGSSIGASTETVWATEVGNWNQFTDPTSDEVNPDDSIEFTTIYRSPIKWLLGQKSLLIGAESMEYTASADGIFSPGDLGVQMQSTHGSSNVQPVGMGQYALFPSDNGTKVRAFKYIAEDEGWVAPDLTLLHPTLFNSGIKRMVRLRNPHQMCVVVMGNGQVAILHLDTYAGISGWSRLNFNAQVKDACVLVDDEGNDVLYLTILRWINGVKKLYVEAITDWFEAAEWTHLQSYSVFLPPTPTNVISALDHLEGLDVQVIGDRNYLGTYKVSGGVVTLIDDKGDPIKVSAATVGLAMPCTLVTMPLVGQDPGSKKRYASLSVRTLASARPLVNGERSATRAPLTLQNRSQYLDYVYDSTIQPLGWDEFAPVRIEEVTPQRVEVAGIFGKVKGNSV